MLQPWEPNQRCCRCHCHPFKIKEYFLHKRILANQTFFIKEFCVTEFLWFQKVQPRLMKASYFTFWSYKENLKLFCAKTKRQLLILMPFLIFHKYNCIFSLQSIDCCNTSWGKQAGSKLGKMMHFSLQSFDIQKTELNWWSFRLQDCTNTKLGHRKAPP